MIPDPQIRFAAELPDGWTAVSPESVGLRDVSLVAVRNLSLNDPVVTNLAVGTYATAREPDLAAIAAAALADLREQSPVTVLNSNSVHEGAMSEFNQLLQIGHPVGDTMVDLRQIRILIAAPEGEDGVDGVLQLVMTCPAAAFREAASEFQHFVATIAPAGADQRRSGDLASSAGSPPSAAIRPS